ncbi:MAG: Glycine dehydrogenase (decarboxylating) [Alphaproteobacteria bacterium MarineAlpha4_Bin2]|nr:MAG: Glycine dehydrogenase (decarboxylating) [Alphaproteobacteria bacterium MarineAlpha4_Bin2]
MPDATSSMIELEQTKDFSTRHIGPRDTDITSMLSEIGVGSLDELIDIALPSTILDTAPLKLSTGRSEADVISELRKIADANHVMKSLIGTGYYNCITPPIILRNVMENPGWYTAYTPYQPEISQGRLEALLNFQTMVSDLTGMEIANASLLDEGTAAAEAMTMARRVGKSQSNRFFVASDCHPQTIDVLTTRATPLDIELVVGDPSVDLNPENVFAALLQYPSTDGSVRDYRDLSVSLHTAGAMLIVSTDLLALTLLKPPGEWGADIVVGSAQRFGVPLGFGGPHAAFFATSDAHKRAMPGRLVGVSVDTAGRPALRLALQTREQHIRREKATSNICTAQVLLAVMAGFYAVYHGPNRLLAIAERVHKLTAILSAGLTESGVEVETKTFFDTLTIKLDDPVSAHDRAHAAGYNLRPLTKGRIGISLDERCTGADVEVLWDILGAKGAKITAFDNTAPSGLPAGLRRKSKYLTHPSFHLYHSETEMLRYLRRLQQKDIALDRSMIPLGSCTMKLNATTEMIPVTWPEFADIHPFAPLDQAAGYLRLTDELEVMLCQITGFDAVSLQPNAGSQGEYAGLLAIRHYHESRGEEGRDICLIPSSAHGTNPASAVMAGMRVDVVSCDKDGNIDIGDLETKASKNTSRLAALMVTYPSTHGVFEESIVDICDIIHRYGGQVYMDGANLNALVGVSRPGRFGPDVAHLNLHKTFCIPHGGGGPGIGPIGVRAHLKPFLPGHRHLDGPAGENSPVSAAPWGSAGILAISWSYIALMGGDGLKRATQVAILNANYMAHRLEPHFPVLYKGMGGLVAHECIIDVRSLKENAGISVEDIAKRLMDFGFHAPTMSWPVAGTLMIEPTESESREELDRFCNAMITIRDEVSAIEAGEFSQINNPLVNAPHTADDLMGEWDRPYAREQAAYPTANQRNDKYWPPVSRINQVYGDRHLVCSCPPLEAYLDSAD